MAGQLRRLAQHRASLNLASGANLGPGMDDHVRPNVASSADPHVSPHDGERAENDICGDIRSVVDDNGDPAAGAHAAILGDGRRAPRQR
jgi:hypothetical protein